MEGKYSILHALEVLSRLKLFDNGRQIHALCVKRGFCRFIVLASTLMDLHIKCGRPVHAQKVFTKMLERDVVSWTSLIMGPVQHEQDAKLLTLFLQTTQEGLKYGTMASCGYAGDPRVFCGNAKATNGSTVTASACSDPQNYLTGNGDSLLRNSKQGHNLCNPSFATKKLCDLRPFG